MKEAQEAWDWIRTQQKPFYMNALHSMKKNNPFFKRNMEKDAAIATKNGTCYDPRLSSSAKPQSRMKRATISEEKRVNDIVERNATVDALNVGKATLSPIKASTTSLQKGPLQRLHSTSPTQGVRKSRRDTKAAETKDVNENSSSPRCSPAAPSTPRPTSNTKRWSNPASPSDLVPSAESPEPLPKERSNSAKAIHRSGTNKMVNHSHGDKNDHGFFGTPTPCRYSERITWLPSPNKSSDVHNTADRTKKVDPKKLLKTTKSKSLNATSDPLLAAKPESTDQSETFNLPDQNHLHKIALNSNNAESGRQGHFYSPEIEATIHRESIQTPNSSSKSRPKSSPISSLKPKQAYKIDPSVSQSNDESAFPESGSLPEPLPEKNDTSTEQSRVPGLWMKAITQKRTGRPTDSNPQQAGYSAKRGLNSPTASAPSDRTILEQYSSAVSRTNTQNTEPLSAIEEPPTVQAAPRNPQQNHQGFETAELNQMGDAGCRGLSEMSEPSRIAMKPKREKKPFKSSVMQISRILVALSPCSRSGLV